jgi:hypothetical protein
VTPGSNERMRVDIVNDLERLAAVLAFNMHQISVAREVGLASRAEDCVER